jgi:hypothetical protein
MDHRVKPGDDASLLSLRSADPIWTCNQGSLTVWARGNAGLKSAKRPRDIREESR